MAPLLRMLQPPCSAHLQAPQLPATVPALSCLCAVEKLKVQAALDPVPSTGLGRASLRRYSAVQTRKIQNKQRKQRLRPPHALQKFEAGMELQGDTL